MANTYTQIHLHAVFAVKYRQALIHPLWKERLHQYITGIVQNNSHKLLCINSMPDHMHLLFGYRPAQPLPDLMRFVKGDSSEWINKQHLTASVFRWQEGYGAFSYAPAQLSSVISYIQNQEAHHRVISFREEYTSLLTEFNLEYDPRYIFNDQE